MYTTSHRLEEDVRFFSTGLAAKPVSVERLLIYLFLFGGVIVEGRIRNIC